MNVNYRFDLSSTTSIYSTDYFLENDDIIFVTNMCPPSKTPRANENKHKYSSDFVKFRKTI